MCLFRFVGCDTRLLKLELKDVMQQYHLTSLDSNMVILECK